MRRLADRRLAYIRDDAALDMATQSKILSRTGLGWQRAGSLYVDRLNCRAAWQALLAVLRPGDLLMIASLAVLGASAEERQAALAAIKACKADLLLVEKDEVLHGVADAQPA